MIEGKLPLKHPNNSEITFKMRKNAPIQMPCFFVFSIKTSKSKIKSAPTEVSAPKNANSNCRQTN